MPRLITPISGVDSTAHVITRAQTNNKQSVSSSEHGNVSLKVMKITYTTNFGCHTVVTYMSIMTVYRVDCFFYIIT